MVSMRFYREHLDIETPVQWYFCDANAPFVPMPTAFGSGCWDAQHGIDLEQVGEKRVIPEIYLNPKNKGRQTGLCYAGDNDLWLNGL